MQAVRLRASVGSVVTHRLQNAKRFHGMICYSSITEEEPQSFGEYLMAQATDNAMDFEKSTNETSGIIGYCHRGVVEILDSGGANKHIVVKDSPCLLPEPVRINGLLNITIYAANTDSEVGVIVYIS